jgi:hypothetical protein
MFCVCAILEASNLQDLHSHHVVNVHLQTMFAEPIIGYIYDLSPHQQTPA